MMTAAHILPPDFDPATDSGASDLLCVPGLSGAAVATGVKPSGRLDLALVVAQRPMTVAGLFTTSNVAAAPVRLCQRRIAAQPYARSLVINAGNANALTGPQGDRDAEAMVRRLEERCGGPALVLSTGVIGVPLPLQSVLEGIDAAATRLGGAASHDVASAILTTDTCTKTAGARIDGYTVGGLAKGSGMIHPNMATMLAVVATDAPVDPATLQHISRRAVDGSFHEISVDGDTSTNDAVLLLAGRPSPKAPPLRGQALRNVEHAIGDVMQQLALQVVRDGEGLSRLMVVEVGDARTKDEARRVAAAIACSSLVKTALAGGDPNWGRILSAAGTAGVSMSPEQLTLRLGEHVVFRHGCPTEVDQTELSRTFAAPEVHMRLSLGSGCESGRMVTTDLSRRYVELNSEYTT